MIDVAFVQVRPSPWRQAVDLGNMMLVLAVRTDPGRVCQDDRLVPGFCAQLLGQMEQMEQVLRSSGQYGARVEVPGGAGTQTRLLGFIGRDPFWPGAMSRTPRDLAGR